MPHPDEFAAGGIYYVNDSYLRLPGENAGRDIHTERRPVVIVSDQNGVHGTNAQGPDDWPSVLAIPISSSTTRRTRFCVPIAAGEGNLKKKGWARVPAVQIMPKEALEDLAGFIEQSTLDGVTGQLLNYLGILPAGSAGEGETEA